MVPNYNYAQYLAGRLSSVFAQTHPVAEIVVLDDASTDNSAAVLHDTAANAGRSVRWLCNSGNSGSVFKQWRRAADLARSEWLWIAEADDQADPGFLWRYAQRWRPRQMLSWRSATAARWTLTAQRCGRTIRVIMRWLARQCWRRTACSQRAISCATAWRRGT